MDVPPDTTDILQDYELAGSNEELSELATPDTSGSFTAIGDEDGYYTEIYDFTAQ